MIFAATVLLTVLAGAEAPRVQNAILGVRIGSSAAEVKTNLSPHGSAEGRRTRDGGVKEVWTLSGTAFSSVAVKLNAGGRVVWVTGFVRPGREIPFKELGDIAGASTASVSRVVWDVPTADGGYRLIARGTGGRAQAVSLLSFDRQPE